MPGRFVSVQSRFRCQQADAERVTIQSRGPAGIRNPRYVMYFVMMRCVRVTYSSFSQLRLKYPAALGISCMSTLLCHVICTTRLLATICACGASARFFKVPVTLSTQLSQQIVRTEINKVTCSICRAAVILWFSCAVPSRWSNL